MPDDIKLLDGSKIRRRPGRPRTKTLHTREERQEAGKVGRRTAPIPEVYSHGQVLDIKVKILEMLNSEEATTLTEAADKLGVPATRVHHWAQNDPDFKELVGLAREVAADRIEKAFQTHANFIPQMMLLKGYRPMFRDNAHLTQTNPALDKLLEDLRLAGKRQLQEGAVETTAREISNDETIVDAKTGSGEAKEPIANQTS